MIAATKIKRMTAAHAARSSKSFLFRMLCLQPVAGLVRRGNGDTFRYPAADHGICLCGSLASRLTVKLLVVPSGESLG